jgi:GH25 family lysozyme M1 (1,4-beta-N-acetylmuramidase)
MSNPTKHNYERSYVEYLPYRAAVKGMAARWATLALGIDISHYQKIISAGWKGLKDKARIDFAFAKSSEGIDYVDPSFAEHVQGAYDVDIPMLGYHYFRTGYYVEYGMDEAKWPKAAQDKQLLNVQNAIRNKKLYGFMLDIEDTTQMTTWTATAAGIFAGRLRDWLNKEYGDSFLLIDYLGEWMWNNAKDQFSWLTKNPLSIARYPYDKAEVVTDWETLRESHFPAASAAVPTLCCPAWDFWQFSGDKFVLPYVTNQNNGPTHLDLDFYNGTKEALYKRIGFVAKGGPNPQPSPSPSDGEGESTPGTTTLEDLEQQLNKVDAAIKAFYKVFYGEK